MVHDKSLCTTCVNQNNCHKKDLFNVTRQVINMNTPDLIKCHDKIHVTIDCSDFKVFSY